jgi:hypothetical protein
MRESCRGCSAALTAAVAFLDSRQLGMVSLLDRQAKELLKPVQVSWARSEIIGDEPGWCSRLAVGKNCYSTCCQAAHCELQRGCKRKLQLRSLSNLC